ncbi:MAG: hypothetical protein KGL78_06440 [Burkholderiales bacterium]|nr:hypothetical protein [Burkholderiales bacterium]
MSTPSLSRLTIQTMANYHVAASQMVAATGAGSRRLVDAVDGTLRTRVLARAAELAPAPVQRMETLSDDTSRRMTQGIRQLEQVAEASIERSNRFAAAQLVRFAEIVAEVKSPAVAEGLQTAARLSMPAAQLALQVSTKVAEGATALADAAGAHAVRAVVRKTAKGARRGAAKAAAGTRKAVAKAAKTPRVQRARRAVKQAA